MKIKEWMIGIPIVLIVGLGSVYVSAKLIEPVIVAIQEAQDSMETINETYEELTSEDCYRGIIAADQTWEMPKELREISGMDWVDDSVRVATIQDKDGIVFIYNLTDGNVESKIDFGKPGDYEGIAVVNNSYFILRADGYLFEVNPAGRILNEYDLPLTAKDDTEGLFFDAPNNRLLIGQKEGGKDIMKKGIFVFDLKTNEFNSDPAYSFDTHLSLCEPADSLMVLTEDSTSAQLNINQTSTDYKKGKTVNPSDLAIHPGTGEIFILDGPNDRVLVLTAQGEPDYFLKLEKLFEQAEGIMFSDNGDLYISTEGIKNPGSISKVSVSLISPSL